MNILQSLIERVWDKQEKECSSLVVQHSQNTYLNNSNEQTNNNYRIKVLSSENLDFRLGYLYVTEISFRSIKMTENTVDLNFTELILKLNMSCFLLLTFV